MVTSPAWPEDIGILIPAFQAAGTLDAFLPRLLCSAPASSILIVDDGSSDATVQVAGAHGIECLCHEKNCGKGAALTTGFSRFMERGVTAIITIDADGQHAIVDLHHFVEFFRQHPDVGICIGKRQFKVGRMPIARIFSNTVTSWFLTVLCGVPILDSQCGYRLYSSSLLRAITITCPRFEMESEVIIKAAKRGFSIRFIEVQTLYFKTKSHIAHIADTIRWIKATLGIWRLYRSTRTSV
jgi:glycosyltransferase involved in cell wall biosynthesis